MRRVISLLLILAFAFFVATMALDQLWISDQGELISAGTAVLEQTPYLAGAANTVTAVVVQFRGLDTLGEVTVLFLAALGVALLAHEFSNRGLRDVFADDGGFVLQHGARFLLPVIVLLGVYIVVHGHLSPGGGFPGGVLIATAVYAVIMAGGGRIPQRLLMLLEGLAGLTFVALGLLGLFGAPQSFLANTLGTGVLGRLFSAGLIPLIYAVVGVKVASELSNVVVELTGTAQIQHGRTTDAEGGDTQ